MKSGFARLFLLAAFVYAVLTAGELVTYLLQLQHTGMPSQEKIFMGFAQVMRWAIDPVFMCGTAVMVEFLEHIWKELAIANSKRP